MTSPTCSCRKTPPTSGRGVQALFGLGTAPTFISSPGNAGPGTFTATSPFNYAAVHQGTAEIVFFFATPQTSITFGPDTPQLSGINFYSVASAVPTSAVPEPSTWAMMLLGFAGLGFAFRQSRRKVSFA
jgi:PEP-CTERM motif